MSTAIRSIPADSAEYARDYTNGWRASQRAADWNGAGLSPLERADMRDVSHAWYDGYEDYAVGHAKWTKRDERLAGDHEPETRSYRCPCCGTDVIDSGPVCEDCRKAACEATTDAVGEVGYWDCQQDTSEDQRPAWREFARQDEHGVTATWRWISPNGRWVIDREHGGYSLYDLSVTWGDSFVVNGRQVAALMTDAAALQAAGVEFLPAP